MTTPLWTLAEAIPLCQLIETKLKGDYHVGLCGSVLHDGQSDNDLDLTVNKHYDSAAEEPEDHEIAATIIGQLLGCNLKLHKQNRDRYDSSRAIYNTTFNNKPVNIFIVNF